MSTSVWWKNAIPVSATDDRITCPECASKFCKRRFANLNGTPLKHRCVEFQPYPGSQDMRPGFERYPILVEREKQTKDNAV